MILHKNFCFCFIIFLCRSVVSISTDADFLPSRYDPRQSDINNPPYVITETRLKEIRSHLMYWYFDKRERDDQNSDWQRDIQNSSPQIQKNLNFKLPFFGFRYNYTRVSMNGYLEFSDPPPYYDTYPLVFPVKDWPKQNDPSFIGIFYSKCRMGVMRPDDVDRRKEGVYFRIENDLQTRTDQFGVELRERVKWDIREGIIGAETFKPKHVIITTWKNVSFAGGIPRAAHTTNTFQLVLATDEVFTYAMFNYLDLQWTTHTEALGDTMKGEGGIPAFIGFNAGNGTRSYEYMPYSQSSIIRDLTGRGWGNGFKGRHIFRIDEKIVSGSCNIDIDGASLPLVFAPESGNMLGGTVVNITGPCFQSDDKVLCKFDTETVYGTVVNSNRAVCVQPLLLVEGYVRFEIAIGSERYKWKGRYFVETPAFAQKIFFDDYSVDKKNPVEIEISWLKHNLTTNENANVRISLWGYRELTSRPEFMYIDEIASDIINNGRYTISPAAFRNRDNRNSSDIKFGFLQINLTEPIPIEGTETRITPVIWSRPIPLGWYFAPQWERIYGRLWAEEICSQWIKNDKYLGGFANTLPQCPCTLEQALSDKGRYLPDFDCDKDSNPKCYYNRGAIHCVRTGSPTQEGYGQQCCYDRYGYLMLSHDQQWGSSLYRSHYLGLLPWNEANKVPTLSNWNHDIVPKYLCCMWQHEQAEGCETLRFERRPTQDCKQYRAPAIAGVFGSHFITFDDVSYTFNGKGEFVLVRSVNKKNRLDIQARFEQRPKNIYGEVHATQMTSVVARGNSSTIVEVRLRPQEAQWRHRLDVFVDRKRVYFDRYALEFQHFSDVTVYTPTYILNQSEVVIMFDSGAGLQVVENKGYMTARVYLPHSYINQTRGLLGNWNSNKLDDLMDPNDVQVTTPDHSPNYVEQIYYDFGLKWMVTDVDDPKRGNALFVREFGKTSSYYNDEAFKPEFKMAPEDILPANNSVEIVKAYELCSMSPECRYDYSVTFNRDLVHFTLDYQNAILKLKQTNNRPVISCGVLKTPRFGRKSTFLFIPGTKVKFECDEGYGMVGDVRRECLPDGRWNEPTYGDTKCVHQTKYLSRQDKVTLATWGASLDVMFSGGRAFRNLEQKKLEHQN